MPGPRPDPRKPYSRSRVASRTGLVELPAECTLPAPAMPPVRDWSPVERDLWVELWRSPQASQWDDSFGTPLAMYVVHVCAVLSGEASAWQATEARHLAERLGLTPIGLRSLGWALPEEAEPAPSRAPGRYDHLRAVPHDKPA